MLGDLFARLFFGRPGLTMMWFAAVARRDRFGLADYRAMLRFPEGIRSTRRIFQASLRDLPGLYAPVEAALGAVHVPCRVVWGDRDPFFPASVGTRTASHIPGADLVSLRGCGHFLPEEDPQGFAASVLDLVRGPASCHRNCSPTSPLTRRCSSQPTRVSSPTRTRSPTMALMPPPAVKAPSCEVNVSVTNLWRV